MRVLALAVILVLLASPAMPQESPGPKLEISSWNGQLQSGRTGTLSLEIANNGSVQAFSGSPEALSSWLKDAGGRAFAVQADLESADERIEILSGPQPAGSIDPGERREMKFAARAIEEAGPGVYPLQLTLSYQELSQVDSSGQPPDVAFEYREQSLEIPLQVEVAKGPRLEIEAGGDLRPGAHGQVEVSILNRGDRKAENASFWPISQPPLLYDGAVVVLGDLDPGASGRAKLELSVEEDAPSGYYALPCTVECLSAGRLQTERMAALIEVNDRSWTSYLWLPALGLLLACGLYVAVSKRRGKKFKRR
ncbi:MAG: hypothetical protein HPY61_10910 [Methanotrichaceae archaeon]|nr:hypothetical protein [Methanotrichaceae archaeon]